MTTNTENQVETTVKTKELPKYSEEVLAAVFDSLMFEGVYEEEFDIKGRLKVKLKSKSADELNQIAREVDSSSFNLISTVQQHRAFLAIVYGMVSYNNRDLSAVSVEERKKFVGKIPSPVVSLISDIVNEFDRKVDLACQDGEENF